MGFKKNLLALLAVVFFQPAIAVAKPEFVSTPVVVTSPYGAAFDFDLSTFLKASSSGLLWAINGPVPAGWTASIDTTVNHLKGQPPAGFTGSVTLGLAVNDPSIPGDGGTLGSVQINVVSVPSWSVTNINLGVTPEGTAFKTVDLKSFVSDPAGGTLSYSLSDPSGVFPAWLKLNADGTITGTSMPTRANVGPIGGFSFVATSTSGGKASVTASGSVLLVFKGPKWTNTAFTLPNGTQDTLYSQNVSGASFIAYTEAPPLLYEIYDGVNNSWVAIDPAKGIIQGTPARANAGAVTLKARISAVWLGTTYSDVTTFTFAVKAPPAWTTNPVVLPNGETRQAYVPQDLKAFVNYPGPTTSLTFKILSWSGPGQAWASLTGSTIGGTPQNASLGVHTWNVQVSDGQFTANANVQITVVNLPPAWLTHPVVLKPDATENSVFTASLAPYAKDPENDPLVFTLISGPAWATIVGGQLTGTPHRSDINLQTFQIQVSDALSGGGDITTVQVMVNKINLPPAWNTFTLPDAPERSLYNQPLAGFVTDPDAGDTFTYKKLSGPAWGDVNANTGVFSGTPQRADVGKATFVFQVMDQGGLSAQTTVSVNVVKVPRAPVCQSPASLADAFQATAYSSTLASLVKDLDNETLSYQATTASTWLKTSAAGLLSGTPAESDIGTYTMEYDITNTDGLSCHLVANGKVVRTNWPPVVAPINLTVKERQVLTVNMVPQYVSDQDATDKLTFAPISWPAWAIMTPTGSVILSPLFAQISPPNYAFNFTVTDGKATVPGTVNVVVVRDPRPPVWATDPIIFTTTAGQPFNATLANQVKDLDGLKLTFTQVSGPTSTWLTVGADGSLSGTPQESDVGSNTYTISAANDAASKTATVIVKVLTANHPPQWTKTPVVLPDAFVGENYAQSLSSFATDQDAGDTLSFLQVTTSPWAFVTSLGLVIGTPQTSDLGLNHITVRVKDQKGASADVDVQITVRNRGQKPKWTKDPIDLGTAYITQNFTFDLTPFAIDPDGNPVRFRKGNAGAALPAWIHVSTLGLVSGVPQAADLGAYTTVFEVSDDGTNWVPVNAFGKVAKQVTPPKLVASALYFTVKVGDTLKQNLNTPTYITNPDGDLLTFALLNGEPWATVDANGNLQAQPLAAQIGDHTYQLKVTGASGATDTAALHIKVIKGADPVTWSEDPIRFTATVNKAFTASLKGKVVNPDSLALVFLKASGPAWLTIDASAGALSGTPPKVGDDYFSVTVTPNGQSPIAATLIVTVVPDVPNSDSVRIDDPVPGARVDNLWVVDNSRDPCSGESCLISSLKGNIEIYYNELAKARVNHYGVYLSSDACRYRNPITDSRGQVLLSYDDRFWAKSFINRIDRSPGESRFNSPLVATWNFLYTPVMSVPKPYYEAKVPMEMMYITPTGDMYGNYSFPATVGWTPTNYVQYVLNESKKAQKKARVSVFGPSGSASYQTAVRNTGGKLYAYGVTQIDDAIRDYAQEVIFRAYVNAHGKIKLTKTPTDPTTIKVTLAGTVLTADKWKYDPSTNEVEIYWYLIDMSTLKAGDRVVIEYR